MAQRSRVSRGLAQALIGGLAPIYQSSDSETEVALLQTEEVVESSEEEVLQAVESTEESDEEASLKVETETTALVHQDESMESTSEKPKVASTREERNRINEAVAAFLRHEHPSKMIKFLEQVSKGEVSSLEDILSLTSQMKEQESSAQRNLNENDESELGLTEKPKEASTRLERNRTNEHSGEEKSINIIEAVAAFLQHQDPSKLIKFLQQVGKGQVASLEDILSLTSKMKEQEQSAQRNFNENDESELDLTETESLPSYDADLDASDLDLTPSGYMIRSLDGAEDESTDGGVSNSEPLPKKKRLRRTGTIKKSGVRWDPDGDQGVAIPCRGEHVDVDDEAVEKIFTSPEYAQYYTRPKDRIVNPQPGDIYIYEKTLSTELSTLCKMDGYRWRCKGYRKTKLAKYTFSEVYAMTAVSEVYNLKFKKKFFFDEATGKTLVQYHGDPRFGLANAEVLALVPIEQWYEDPFVVHPTDARGNVGSKAEKYWKHYNSVPDELRMKPSKAVSQVVMPPLKEKSPTGDAGSDSDHLALTQEEMARATQRRRQRKRRQRERRPGEVTPDETDGSDEEEEDIDDPAPSQGSIFQQKTSGKKSYKSAQSFVTADPTKGLSLAVVLELKKRGDYLQEKALANNREAVYQSTITTIIENPQPNQVYYRDLRKVEGHNRNLNYDFEAKEARQDGYTWRRNTHHFLKQEWCDIFKSTYIYCDNETGVRSSKWAKNFYIFPKEDKMMIVYKGDNSIANFRPHGNDMSGKAPDHYTRLPEVRSEIIDIIDNNPEATNAEVYRRMTGADRAGPGLQGVVNVPKNTRAVKNIYQNLSRAASEFEIHTNLVVANSIAGGTILRRAEILRQENRFIVLIHDDAISEFKDICRNYKGNLPLRLHLDTSFNAGGKKSGMVITHLLLDHPYVTRARSGESETGVNVPLAALVHQRRTMPTINQLLTTADDAFKFGDVKQSTVLVSDREFGDQCRLWRGVTKVFCWNHIRQDVELKAKRTVGIRQDDADQISNEVFDLLRCHNEDEYLALKNQYFTDATKGHDLWRDGEFQHYIDTFVDPDIRNYSGRWKLAQAGIPNPENGITNNRAESLNASFNRHKVAHIKGGFAHVLLCYADIATATIKEVKKAYFKQGDMQLNHEHQHLALPPSLLPAINYKTYPEMLKQLRRTPGYIRMTDPAEPTPTKRTENPQVDAILDQLTQQEIWYLNPDNKDSYMIQDDYSARVAKYPYSLAQAHARDTYFVRVFPEMECSCPQGPVCAHIFFLRKKSRLELSAENKIEMVKRYVKDFNRQRREGRADLGKKQPARDSYFDPTMETPRTSLAARNLFGITPRGRGRGRGRSRTPSPGSPGRNLPSSRTPSPRAHGRTRGRARFPDTSGSSRSPSPASDGERTHRPTLSDSSVATSPTRRASSLSTHTNRPQSPAKRTLTPVVEEDDEDEDLFGPSPQKTLNIGGRPQTAMTPQRVPRRCPSPLATTSFPPQTVTVQHPSSTSSLPPNVTSQPSTPTSPQPPDQTAQPPTPTMPLPPNPTTRPPTSTSSLQQDQTTQPPTSTPSLQQDQTAQPPTSTSSLQKDHSTHPPTSTSSLQQDPTTQDDEDEDDEEDDDKDMTKSLKKSKFGGLMKSLGKSWERTKSKTVRFKADDVAPPKTRRKQPMRRSLERVAEYDRIPLYHRSEDLAFITPQGNIDLKYAIEHGAELKKLQIYPQEARWVEMNGRQMALIKSIGTGRAVVFYDADFSTSGEDLAFIAGQITQEDAFVNASGDLCFRVSFRESANQKEFIRKATAGMVSQSLQLGPRPKEYPLICTCCTPHISYDHAERLKFEFLPQCKCLEIAHPACVAPSVRQSVEMSGQFECTPCLVKELTPGVRWSEPPGNKGELMINTCPVDNFLTGLTIFTNEQNADLLGFFPDDDQHRNLKDTLDLVGRLEFNLAQTKYYKECKQLNDDFLALPDTKQQIKEAADHNKKIKEVQKRNKPIRERNAKIAEKNKSNPNGPQKPLEPLEKEEPLKSVALPIDKLPPKFNLWGEVYTRVHDKHKAGFQVTKFYQCSNPTCSNHNETTDTMAFVQTGPYLNYDNDLNGVEDLQQMIRPFEQLCRECNQGMSTQKDFVATKDTWALSFDFASVNVDRRDRVKIDILNGKLPDTITINNDIGEPQIYGLAMMTMQDGGHFVSAHYIPSRGEFVFYDGMKDPRIRKFHPSDLMDENRKLTCVDYFRLT